MSLRDRVPKRQRPAWLQPGMRILARLEDEPVSAMRPATVWDDNGPRPFNRYTCGIEFDGGGLWQVAYAHIAPLPDNAPPSRPRTPR